MAEIKRFIPLNEVRSPRLRISVDFPQFVPVQEIGVDLARVALLSKLGGIRHLEVTSQADQETSRSIPLMVGMNEQAMRHRDQILPHEAQWINGSIVLNLNEITQRIGSDPRYNRDVRSSHAWAAYLDESLKEGITDLGWEHLTSADRLWFSGCAVLTALFVWGIEKILYGPNTSLLEVSAIWFFANHFAHLERTRKELNKYGPLDPEFGYRKSLIWGPQYDRAILQNLWSRTGKIVKALPQSSQSTEV